MVRRHRFEVSADTGAGTSPWADTGPVFWGTVQQIAWRPTTADTGGDLQIGLKLQADDTGAGVVIYEDTDCLGVEFIRPIRHAPYGSGGDTGATADSPIYSAGGRFRVLVTAGATCVGTLFIWTDA